jgi:hypothetical protein
MVGMLVFSILSYRSLSRDDKKERAGHNNSLASLFCSMLLIKPDAEVHRSKQRVVACGALHALKIPVSYKLPAPSTGSYVRIPSKSYSERDSNPRPTAC